MKLKHFVLRATLSIVNTNGFQWSITAAVAAVVAPWRICWSLFDQTVHTLISLERQWNHIVWRLHRFLFCSSRFVNNQQTLFHWWDKRLCFENRSVDSNYFSIQLCIRNGVLLLFIGSHEHILSFLSFLFIWFVRFNSCIVQWTESVTLIHFSVFNLNFFREVIF